jgi:hypothetical protein
LLLTHLSLPFLWEASTSTYGLETTILSESSPDENRLGGTWRTRRKICPRLYDIHSWRSGARVDPLTGDLLVRLGHILQFNSSPLRVPSSGGRPPPDDREITLYRIKEGSCSVVLVFENKGPQLDKIVPKGKNHLFYLEKEEETNSEMGSTEYLLLILQEIKETAAAATAADGDDDCLRIAKDPKFKLVLCFSYDDIFLTSPDARPDPPPPPPYISRSPPEVNVRHSLYSTLLTIREDIIEPQSALTTAPKLREWELEYHGWIRMLRFLCDSIRPLVSEVLPLGQSILSAERSGAGVGRGARAFADAFVAYLDRTLREREPRAVDEADATGSHINTWIEMTVSQHQSHFYFRYDGSIQWQYSSSPFGTAPE